MSVTLEDSSNSIPRYIGHRELTEDDIRYNEELDKEDAKPIRRRGEQKLSRTPPGMRQSIPKPREVKTEEKK